MSSLWYGTFTNEDLDEMVNTISEKYKLKDEEINLKEIIKNHAKLEDFIKIGEQ